jgi:hypothetical protein
VPYAIEPLVFEKVVDWSIEAVYAMVAPNDLWAAELAGARRRRIWPWRRFGAWLQRTLFTATGLMGLLTRSVWHGVFERYPLSPELEVAVAAAAGRTRYIDDVVLAQARQLGQWLSEHQRDVAALFNLVAVAIQEAEGYLAASGAEKKGYARGLVLEALEAAGFTTLTRGMGRALTEWIVDLSIDAGVRLFHKHGRFEHRSAAPVEAPSADVRAAPGRVGAAFVGPPPPGSQRVAAPPTRWTAPGPRSSTPAFAARPTAAGAPRSAWGPGFAPLVDAHMALSRVGWDIVMDHLWLAGDALASGWAVDAVRPPRHRQY